MTSSTAIPSPPHSLEAERTVLGALLLDPTAINDVVPILKPADFYDLTYQIIFGAIEKLHDQREPIDFVTVSESLRDDKRVQDIGGSAFLADLVSDIPTAAHVMQYAEIVRNHSVRRRLAEWGTAVAKLATIDNDKSTAELLEYAEQEFLKLSRQSSASKFLKLKQLAAARFEHYAEVHESPDSSVHDGIRVGFRELDHLLEGLEPGHLMILAGRPSMGKTTLALNIARNVGKQGNVVGIISLEMTQKQLTDRLFASILGVEPSKLKKGTLSDEEFSRVGQGIDQLEQYNIYIDDDTNRTLGSIRSKARRLQMEYGLDLLIVDYLGLIQVTDRAAGDSLVQQVTYISQNLKNLARELQCPVIALSQLSRACEQRKPPIPVLSDLRDSGAIEQDADSVLMLYRDGYYQEDSDDPTLTKVYVRKNRDGATGDADLRLQKAKVNFQAIETINLSQV